MTLYICRCPHLRNAEVFAASSEAEVIDLIVGDTENSFDTALDAARYDMRDAYVTDDVLDLYAWIEGNEAPQATGAARAFFACYDVKADLLALASLKEDEEDVLYTAFDGRFAWPENESAWTLDNREPVEAYDLVQALCAASLQIKFRSVEERDV